MCGFYIFKDITSNDNSKIYYLPNPLGPEVKFKGAFHPVIISPDCVEELSVVNHADDGEFLGSLFS